MVLFEVSVYEVVVAWESVSNSVFEVGNCFSVVDGAGDCFIEIRFCFVFEFDGDCIEFVTGYVSRAVTAVEFVEVFCGDCRVSCTDWEDFFYDCTNFVFCNVCHIRIVECEGKKTIGWYVRFWQDVLCVEGVCC